jgi:hypothetical protein
VGARVTCGFWGCSGFYQPTTSSREPATRVHDRVNRDHTTPTSYFRLCNTRPTPRVKLFYALQRAHPQPFRPLSCCSVCTPCASTQTCSRVPMKKPVISAYTLLLHEETRHISIHIAVACLPRRAVALPHPSLRHQHMHLYTAFPTIVPLNPWVSRSTVACQES